MADDFESSCDYGSYVQKMRRPGTWGSQLELMAICQSFGVNAILQRSCTSRACRPMRWSSARRSPHSAPHFPPFGMVFLMRSIEKQLNGMVFG